MLQSTRGIVLHSIKYSETSVIVKVYTESSGIRSYLVKGLHGPKSKFRPALFQPLSLLELVAYHKEKQTLHTLKEARLCFPYKTIPFDIRKSSIAIFINELIYRAVREEETNLPLFEFLWQACLELDETEEQFSGFHVGFAMQLMHFLGIFPRHDHSARAPIFNMQDGVFQQAVPGHPHYLDREESAKFAEVIRECETGKMVNRAAGKIGYGVEERNRMIDIILIYYRLHLPGFGEIRSHHVLRDVLS